MPADPAAERLRGHLAAYGRRNPQGWSLLERVHLHPEGLPPWPDWCWVPLSAAVSNPQVIRPEDAAAMTGLAAWRPAQGLYRFHQDLLGALWDTPISGDLPSEVLFRMPAWAVYLEAPAGVAWSDQPVLGAFAHLEWDPQARRAELRLLIDHGPDAPLTPLPLHLGGSLEAGLIAMLRESERQRAAQGLPRPAGPDDASAALRAVVEPFVSLLLYLCSDQADYTPPERPRPARTKAGPRLFPAAGPTTWAVGDRIGAAIRAAREAGGAPRPAGAGGTVKPHPRRPHWTTVWLGPRSGRQVPAARWIPWLMVHQALADQQAMPVVVREVQE